MFDITTEEALFYGFFVLVALVIISLVILLVSSGFFHEIEVKACKPYIGEITIAYKFAQGPYKESGKLFTEVHTLLPQYRTIGVYYDDPKKKEQSRLRYAVGLILSENGVAIKTEDEALLKEWNYKFVTFPSINHAVQTTFPFSSTLSIIIAVFRVYPILDEYIGLRNLCVHPFLEIYDNEEGKIYFIGPLEKQDDFYIPEVKEEEERRLGDDEEDQSSVSWDDSASYIRSDANDPDSESIGEDSIHSYSNVTGHFPDFVQQDVFVIPPEPERSCQDPQTDGNTRKDQESHSGNFQLPKVVVEKAAASNDDDSDNTTSSSFEEIDEKETTATQVEGNSETPELKSELKTEL